MRLSNNFFHLCMLHVEPVVQKSIQKTFPNTLEQDGTRAAFSVFMQSAEIFLAD